MYTGFIWGLGYPWPGCSTARILETGRKEARKERGKEVGFASFSRSGIVLKGWIFWDVAQGMGLWRVSLEAPGPRMLEVSCLPLVSREWRNGVQL